MRFPSTPRFSDAEIETVSQGGPVQIADWARSAVGEWKISRRVRMSDTFARAVSRLSDAEVTLDSVEESLIALRRAGAITSFQRGRLQARYLR